MCRSDCKCRLLHVQAAKNLYTGKVNTEVVNRLLENKNFAAMTNMIAHYFDDTLAAGYAAQNQMCSRSSQQKMNMTAVDNEKLCALAQTGDMDALNSLAENNPKQNRVPTGMLLAPIGNPEPRDASRLPARSVLQNALHFEVSTGDPHPSGHLEYFPRKWYPNCKNMFSHVCTFLKKYHSTRLQFLREPCKTLSLRCDVSMKIPYLMTRKISLKSASAVFQAIYLC